MIAVNCWEVSVWDAATGRRKARREWSLRGGSGTSLRFSPDGKLLAFADDSGNVTLWDWAEDEIPFWWHTGSNVRSVAFSPDGKLLASAGRDRVIRLWALPPAKKPKK